MASWPTTSDDSLLLSRHRWISFCLGIWEEERRNYLILRWLDCMMASPDEEWHSDFPIIVPKEIATAFRQNSIPTFDILDYGRHLFLRIITS